MVCGPPSAWRRLPSRSGWFWNRRPRLPAAYWPRDWTSLPKLLAGLWLAARVVGSVVTVPIAEELAFRGYLTRRLIASEFTTVSRGRLSWLSFVVSSIVFVGLHGRYVAGALAGAIYALALYRKGSVSESILAHATTNALIAAYVLSTGTWSLWL